MHNEDEDSLERLKTCLRGVKQSSETSFAELISLEDWREVAMIELQRRSAHALRLFPGDLLEKIAFDMMDTRRAMTEVLAEPSPGAR